MNGGQLQLDAFTVYGANGDIARGAALKELLIAHPPILERRLV